MGCKKDSNKNNILIFSSVKKCFNKFIFKFLIQINDWSQIIQNVKLLKFFIVIPECYSKLYNKVPNPKESNPPLLGP